MKRFKVGGWYTLQNEEGYKIIIIKEHTLEKAIESFKEIYIEYNFYKIDVEDWS